MRSSVAASAADVFVRALSHDAPPVCTSMPPPPPPPPPPTISLSHTHTHTHTHDSGGEEDSKKRMRKVLLQLKQSDDAPGRQ